MVTGMRRRTFLERTAAAAVAATAVGLGPGRARGATTGSGWPMHLADAANTGHAPGDVGPKRAVEEHRFRFAPEVGAPLGPPVVARGLVYAAVGSRVIGVDPATGDQRWLKHVDDPVAGAPAVVDGTVYAATRSGVVRAMDARSSADVWRYDGGHNRTSSSPVVTDDGVYLADGLGRVHGIDRATGRQRWQRGTWGHRMPATPAVADGTLYYMGQGEGVFHAVDTADGSERWSAEPGDSAASPTVAGDTVVVPVTEPEGAILALGTDGEERWRTAAPVAAAPATDGELLYVPGDAGLRALGLDGGDVRWTADLGSRAATPPALADGALHIGTADGAIHGVGAGSGELLWSTGAGRETASAPAVADGRVLAGEADGTLRAVDGDTTWADDRMEEPGDQGATEDGSVPSNASDDGADGEEQEDQSLGLLATVAGVAGAALAARGRRGQNPP
jgi:outer membrane protein assembly factor BamB